MPYWLMIVTSLSPGNTKGGSITVPLTSCLTGLVVEMFMFFLSFSFFVVGDRSVCSPSFNIFRQGWSLHKYSPYGTLPNDWQCKHSSLLRHINSGNKKVSTVNGHVLIILPPCVFKWRDYIINFLYIYI